jgi:hypothetical protein
VLIYCFAVLRLFVFPPSPARLQAQRERGRRVVEF